FAWGWYRRRRGWVRGVGLVASVGLMGGCVVATQLHGGWRAGGRNGWLLAASDLSFLTLAAWLAVLYVSAKIPLVALRRYGNEAATRVARTWALALVAAMGILMAGM